MIEEKLKEVQDYFKEEILSGNVLFHSFSIGTTTILVTGGYKFCFYTNQLHYPKTIKLWDTLLEEDVNPIKFTFTEEEQVVLAEVFKDAVRDNVRQLKLEQIKKLQNEL